MSGAALEEIERVLDRGGDADDVLRDVVATLVEHGGCRWAGIFFVEDGELVLGPEAGVANEAARTSLPISYQGRSVGALGADGEVDLALLARVASLVATHVLLGWDTRGEAWEP
jgi:putative methionine-R-sulfoxide reductase with GAF domain